MSFLNIARIYIKFNSSLNEAAYFCDPNYRRYTASNIIVIEIRSYVLINLFSTKLYSTNDTDSFKTNICFL